MTQICCIWEHGIVTGTGEGSAEWEMKRGGGGSSDWNT